MRLTTMKPVGLPALLVALTLVACGTGEEPPQEPIDFAGYWLKSDSSSFLYSDDFGLPTNVCVASGRPLQVLRNDDSSFTAREFVGGTFRCVNDGVPQPETNLDAFPDYIYYVLQRGDSLYFSYFNGSPVFRGVLLSNDRVLGRRDSTVDGRSGTWTLTR